MSIEVTLAGAMGALLCLYLLFGGADFGGGVWDLLASGPRAREQRRAVAAAIGPIWEANHVWLILVIVLLFSGFPKAFAAISVALHVPLTLYLLGVVLRGSAFTFRALDTTGDQWQRRFGLVFSIASTISPVLLGMMVGALVSGRIRVEGGIVTSGFFAPWLAPFPLVVGGFTLSLCAFLAATYLTVEVRDPALREDFRRRALVAGVAVGAFALLAFVLAADGAPRVREALATRRWSQAFHGLTALVALGAFAALGDRHFKVARAAVALQTVLILIGWAVSSYPYIIVPDLTLAGAASSVRTQRMLLVVLLAGLPILLPSLVLLFKVFKAPAPRD